MMTMQRLFGSTYLNAFFQSSAQKQLPCGKIARLRDYVNELCVKLLCNIMSFAFSEYIKRRSFFTNAQISNSQGSQFVIYFRFAQNPLI